jgi:signal transduction histidine kinase
VTSDRLTRNELVWLLAQEARTAAQKLRQGVGLPGSADAVTPPVIIEEGTAGVETTLNRLDEAVSMLASLHGQPSPRGRRGKIDLAALLWEVAPEARVQIDVGEGTTVFGDESELRRMLLVLLGQGGDPTSAKGTADVSVRREGDEVRIGVTLGPDKAPTFETERAWLARMATRYGGRITLDGSMQTLSLPADVDHERRELESLKRELAAAQAQGEAYARELAAVRTDLSPTPGPVSSAPPGDSLAAPSGDGLALLVAAARGLGPHLRGILSAIGRDIAPLRDDPGEAGEIASSVARHVTAASELVGDLARLGACPVGELPRHCEVAEIVRDVVSETVVRAARHGVRVVLDEGSGAEAVLPSNAVGVLLHALLDHAIEACPAGSEVAIAISDEPGAVMITFDDAGPPVPARARTGVLSRDFEALAQGRPTGIALVVAHAVAAHTRARLSIEDGPHGGARVRVSLPKHPMESPAEPSTLG